MSVDRLLAQHCRILANVEAVEQFAAGPPPPLEDRMADKRWAFTRDLLLHFAQMESTIYGPMMSDRRAHAQQTAALASVETAALMSEYREHVARWQGPHPAEGWETYRRAVTRLTRRIRIRIEAEAAEIVPLLPVQPDGSRSGPTREGYAAEAWEIRTALFDGIKLPSA
ncbi:hemerythrin domain-containing protein [Sphingomonas psychrotolerans]|uniref:Hemerythrin domain-containing protein n=1 Tax=Sphingomonas psychrotolerans TaxID=1327635 RepID=A0ABU3N0K8_9SPHN|nr:hemerythrin domain-containing protein [Sphingomonas psychrotolerans]MDT8757913.1 hemerythrin domain-containing protein [Sphingomonas psychrotolerans]